MTPIVQSGSLHIQVAYGLLIRQTTGAISCSTQCSTTGVIRVVCGMVDIKDILLLTGKTGIELHVVGKSSPCNGGSGFLFVLFICCYCLVFCVFVVFFVVFCVCVVVVSVAAAVLLRLLFNVNIPRNLL